MAPSPSSEALIHHELYRHLQNAIEGNDTFEATNFGQAIPEHPVDHGRADIVVKDSRGRPILVIEAKRPPVAGGTVSRDLDPYSPVVIDQAFNYAGHLGADYFATYNGSHLVLFETFQSGVSLLNRRTCAYRVSDVQRFASELLHEIDRFISGSGRWDADDQAFISRVRVFHERLGSEFRATLDLRIEDEEFDREYTNWIEAQGWGQQLQNDPHHIHRRFASQAAYLLMNRLVFYKLLEDSDAYDVPEIPLSDLVDVDTRRDVFADIIARVNFEAVYEQDPILDALPLTDVAHLETKEFLDQLETFDLSQFDRDILGQIYQRIIPAEERHNLGQYYTPPEVVDLIIRLAVQSESDRVLDPGCGSGSFLVSAYHYLSELSNKTLGHQDLLDRITGFDINRFPAHLSSINLALRDLEQPTHETQVAVTDFFLISPTQLQAAERVGSGGSELGVLAPPDVDVVVGNPPYIRQELIANKQLCRRHLSDINVKVSKRSDIYTYFMTHAYQFLRAGGRLAFLTSDTWLSTGYGEDLQDFLTGHFRIRYIINFSRQQFDLALIGTLVVVAEVCPDEKVRDDNTVTMVQLTEPSTSEDILEILEEERNQDTVTDIGSHRVVTRTQRVLREETKWNRYLIAPPVYWELMESGRLAPLGELAEIRFGTKSGANKTFYFQDRERWEELGIPAWAVRPLLKNMVETPYHELHEDDLEWFVLDVYEEISELLRGAGDPDDPVEYVKEQLRTRASGLVEYLERMEAEGIDDRPSVSHREVWFSIGDLMVPPLLLSKEYWTESRTLLNECEAAIDQQLYGVWPAEEIDEYVLLGCLNSSLYRMMRELHGRTAQGQAMNRNRVTVSEAERLPVPDLSVVPRKSSELIREAVQRMLARERVAGPEEREELQQDLDMAVMRSIGLGEWCGDVQGAVDELLAARRAGGADEAEALVRTRTPRTIELSGGTRIRSGDGQLDLGL